VLQHACPALHVVHAGGDANYHSQGPQLAVHGRVGCHEHPSCFQGPQRGPRHQVVQERKRACASHTRGCRGGVGVCLCLCVWGGGRAGEAVRRHRTRRHQHAVDQGVGWQWRLREREIETIVSLTPGRTVLGLPASPPQCSWEGPPCSTNGNQSRLWPDHAVRDSRARSGEQ
jgi:hypothetical protein